MKEFVVLNHGISVLSLTDTRFIIKRKNLKEKNHFLKGY